MLSAVNKLTFILSGGWNQYFFVTLIASFSLSGEIWDCCDRMGRNRREQGHSWLDGKVAPGCLLSLSQPLCKSEMLLAELWPPFLPFVLQGGLQVTPWPRAAVQSDALCAHQCLLLSSHHRAFFHFLWAVLVVSTPSALIPYSSKIMDIKHLTWGPYPEAAEWFSNFALVCLPLFFLSKESGITLLGQLLVPT